MYTAKVLKDSEHSQNLTDLNYLTGLADGNNGFVIEMIDLFIKQIPLELSKINTCFETKDWKTLYEAVHKIKPSFCFMSIKKAENIIKSMELCAKTQENLDKMPGLIADITSICNH